MKRFDIVNILRVLATCMVFFLHSLIPKGLRFEGIQVVHDYSWTFILRQPALGGVWIFFVLSGFLAGQSFLHHRYSLSCEGIRDYYLKKIKNVWLPTVFFISAIVFFCVPNFLFLHPDFWLKLVLCTFNGTQSPHEGVGATWFVFTLMWFYMLTPLLVFMIQKYSRHAWGMIGVVCFLGLACRVYCYYTQSLQWYYLYTGVLTNLDLYLGGMCFALLSNKMCSKGGRLLGGGDCLLCCYLIP